MIGIRVGLIALLLVCVGPALALDQGVASGHYDQDGVTLSFAHAVALSQDNTEGLLDHGPQVRVVLSAEEVPIQALYGVVFPPVTQMARAGVVHGVMLEFDPADRTRLHVTVLNKPDAPDAFARNISVSNSEGLWKSLEASATRLSGAYPAGDDTDLVFTFSAPLLTDPVVADLKGADAQKSEQVRVLLARAEAMGRGDMAAAAALSSRQSQADLTGLSPEALKQVKATMGALTKEIKAIKRVVVRQQTAAALMGEGGFSSLVFEDGAWKAAD